MHRLQKDIENLEPTATNALITERSHDEYGNALKVRNADGEMEYAGNDPLPGGTIKDRLGRIEMGEGGGLNNNKLPSDYRQIKNPNPNG